MLKELPIDALINKENLIEPINYKPPILITMDNNENNFHNYRDSNLKPQIASTVEEPFKKIKKDFDKYFSSIDSKLIVDSGYRSYEYQQVVYDKKIETEGIEAAKYVALPGSSEHQSGLAIDFAFFKHGKYVDDHKEDDPEILWLIENSWKYGFILRYPKDKEEITDTPYEWWHYRYVGEDIAKIIHENNLSLEEYHQRYKVKQKIR